MIRAAYPYNEETFATVDPVAPLPGFLVKKGATGLMETATDVLRKRVMKVKGH